VRVPLLAGLGRCPIGYGYHDVNQINLPMPWREWLLSILLLLPLTTPPRSPANGCSTYTSADFATTMDSLDGSHASNFLGSPLKPQCRCLDPSLPVAVPRCLACLVLRTWSVMMQSPFLVYMPLPSADLLLVLWPSHLQTVMTKFPFRIFQPVLLWFRVIVMLRLLFLALCFLVPPPLPVPLPGSG
jgi:hypothetical protein